MLESEAKWIFQMLKKWIKAFFRWAKDIEVDQKLLLQHIKVDQRPQKTFSDQKTKKRRSC